MENQNQNPITPQTLPPSPQHYRWYHHKGAVTIIVLIAVILGLMVFWRFYNHGEVGFDLGPTGCGAKEAQEVVLKKDLQAVRSCVVKDIQVDGKPAKLVGITYGPGMDCMSGCIYNGYMGFLINGKLVDFQGEPETYPVFNDKYGDWCNVQVRDLADNPKVVKSIKSVSGKYYWDYQFNNFDNQDRIKSLLQTSQILKSKDNPQYCILNGEMMITETSSGYAKNIDFSKLNVQFQPMPGATTETTNELIKECDNKIVDGYKIDRADCIDQVAIGKRDPLICNQIEAKDTPFLSLSQGSCMRGVAVFAKDPSICDIITDDLQKNQCFENVAITMKDSSVCDKITNSDKDYCIKNSQK